MSIKVQRYKRHQVMGDPGSPQLYYLKAIPGTFRTRTLKSLAGDLELISSISREDIMHVAQGLSRRMLTVLAEGDKVKIDGLGTFFVTFNCIGSQEEKDCTVRNIRKVNIRFVADNTLRLTNDSTATTRGADNNVKFLIQGETDNSNPPGGEGEGGQGEGGQGGNGANEGGNDENWGDPSA